MNTVSRKKMYKSGKQWVALATVATVAGVAITANDKASADVWQANGVQQVTNQLAQAGGLANYNVQYGDTVWALALANGENLDTFVNQFGIANPDVLLANESFMAQTTTGATVQPQAVTEQTATTEQDAVATSTATPTSEAVVASQVADSVAASQVAASEAASEAASIAASQAAAASYAASVAQSQADAASMAAAESQATAASEAAAQQTASAALAAASSAAVAAQVAAEQASSQQAAASTVQAQVTAESQVQTEATVATVGSADMSTFNALNALRQSQGLAPLTFDNDLAARAQARAQQMANLGGVASDHYSTAGEVVAIDYAPGTSVVNAWFNETNMMPVGTTGHRDWEMNAGYSRVGIAIVGNVIVGEAN
ncbi:CAP domain-containing protein [Weissella cibaria]|uniref:CAP domain-containing protein n=1 Tax=Weissella cibaria TaxID=137591 RepID=UPI001D05755A|nr:CAP domain-containing protein [Weissella cibaria]MCB5825738.1 CAP domain-containing protein [Weissella cibaria]MCB5857297.1 CAP domain-containing protein [Weissella cibaria]MCB5859556.1 CAP domain-containing protein [Weissella cibaria]MCB5861815.1 CAP domain-containing protein [Weissella cibaria]MCB5863811.1 CAP domain-containing protein [Weissella cibaria]